MRCLKKLSASKARRQTECRSLPGLCSPSSKAELRLTFGPSCAGLGKDTGDVQEGGLGGRCDGLKHPWHSEKLQAQDAESSLFH